MRHLVTALVCCLAPAAWADLTMISEISSASRPTRNVTLSVKGPMVLFELLDGPQARTMLRDGTAKKMYAISHEKKEITVITETDSRELEARQQAFRAQLKAQLEKMPPEQRARMEATMLGPDALGDGKTPVFTYEKKKTPERKVGEFTCQDYVVKRDGREDGEGCFTAWKELGITSKDFKLQVASAMPSSSSQSMMAYVFDEDAAPGFPVYRLRFDRDGGKTESTVKSFSKTSLAAEKFVLPKGYRERAMGEALKAQPAPQPQGGSPMPAPAPKN